MHIGIFFIPSESSLTGQSQFFFLCIFVMLFFYNLINHLISITYMTVSSYYLWQLKFFIDFWSPSICSSSHMNDFMYD